MCFGERHSPLFSQDRDAELDFLCLQTKRSIDFEHCARGQEPSYLMAVILAFIGNERAGQPVEIRSMLIELG